MANFLLFGILFVGVVSHLSFAGVVPNGNGNGKRETIPIFPSAREVFPQAERLTGFDRMSFGFLSLIDGVLRLLNKFGSLTVGLGLQVFQTFVKLIHSFVHIGGVNHNNPGHGGGQRLLQTFLSNFTANNHNHNHNQGNEMLLALNEAVGNPDAIPHQNHQIIIH